MPEVSVDFFIFEFEVGNRGFELRIPIDLTLIAIDQTFLIQLNKDFKDGL